MRNRGGSEDLGGARAGGGGKDLGGEEPGPARVRGSDRGLRSPEVAATSLSRVLVELRFS